MQDLYFKNHEAKIIFGLVVLGGKPQMDLLGIILCSIFYFLILFKKKEYKDILLFFISKYKKRKE